MDPYLILGLSNTATVDDAKKAYRQLAMKHHPDRGGSEARFKEIKAAWEQIESGYKPAQAKKTDHPFTKSSWTKPEPVWTGTPTPRQKQKASSTFNQKSYNSKPRIVEAYKPPEVRENLGGFVARVSMKEAFHGFICEVDVNGVKHRVSVPPGVPDGLRFKVEAEKNKDLTVLIKFIKNQYEPISATSALSEAVIANSEPAVVLRTKNLKTTTTILEKDLARGTTLTLEDFLGTSFSVKVQAGHNPKLSIIIPNRGYVDWYTSHSKAGQVRGDVLLYLNVLEKEEFF